MSNDTVHRGFLFVSDITGYTAYLNESELDHARDTLTDLMELLVEASGPPLAIAKLEGDAVFSYGFTDAFVKGETLVQIVETTYVRFRRAIDSMVLNNTCQCNACTNVGALDLKFFVHFGEFIFHEVGGSPELLGPQVALVHRLMKNSISETLAVNAYCAYTQAAVEELGIESFDELVTHAEEIEGFGQVRIAVQDMKPAYERANASRSFNAGTDLMHSMQHEFTMSPAALWDYLSDPSFRRLLIGSDRQEVSERVGGRIDVGTAFVCYHGDKVLPQTILQWSPFERVVTEDTLPKPMKGKATSVIDLEPTPTGTNLVRSLIPPVGGSMVNRLMVPAVRRLASRGFGNFIEAVTNDWEQRQQPNRHDISRETIETEAKTGVSTWTPQ